MAPTASTKHCRGIGIGFLAQDQRRSFRSSSGPKSEGYARVTPALRGLTIFDVLISMLFEVRFPFRFPHAVGESGKRNWEVSWRGGVVEQFAESRGIRFG